MPSAKDLMNQGARTIAARGIQRDVERAARAQAGNTDTVVWVARSAIIKDPEIQVRVHGSDPETVERYTVYMFENQGWGDFPPVDLHRDGETLYLSAGFQRLDAAEKASALLVAEGLPAIDEVPANIRPGGKEAAIEFAEEDNLLHGEPLSLEDKQHMFANRLDRGHRWLHMSNRAIAREIGVSKDTISRWRSAWESRQSSLTGSFEPVRENTGKKSTVLTTDGRVMKTGKIAKANANRATKQSAPKRTESEPAGTFEEKGGSVADHIMTALAAHGELGPVQVRAISGLTVDEFNLVIDDLIEAGYIERRQDIGTGRVTYRSLVEVEPEVVEQDQPDVAGLRRAVLRCLAQAAEALDQLGETDDAAETRRYAASLKAEWKLNS